jgi:hypothetical protein
VALPGGPRVVATQPVTYWICPPGSRQRHAIWSAPRLLRQGSAFTALCEVQMQVPIATPNDREPVSKHIRRRCPSCMHETNKSPCRHIDWDF